MTGDTASANTSSSPGHSALRQIFDPDYYRREAAKRSLSIGDPLQHFLSVGWHLGINPCALFDMQYYIAQNPDAANSALNPLVHYVALGARRGAVFSRDFNVASYIAQNPGSAPNVLAHISAQRQTETHPNREATQQNRADAASISNLIDATWYRTTYRIPAEEEVTAHYLETGFSKRLNPNPFFDIEWLTQLGLNPAHCTQHPLPRKPSPFVDLSWSREHAYSRYGDDHELLMRLSALSSASDASAHPKSAGSIRGNLKSVRDIVDQLEELRRAPKTKLRLGYFSHDLMWQGAQNSLFELAQHFKQSGDFEIILFAFHDGPMRAEYERATIPTVIIPMRMYDADLDALAFIFRALGLDLVHANTTRCYEAIAAANRANIPSVWNIRESDPFSSAFSFVPRDRADWIYANVVPHASAFVFVADSTSALWPPSANSQTIKNGLNETRFLGLGFDTDVAAKISANRIRFLTVGTFTPRKDQMTIVNALNALPDSALSRIHYTFVGALKTNYSMEVVNALERLRDSRPIQVDILQHTSDVAGRASVVSQFAQAHCFVQSSINESYPRVILEALAANCHVIASNTFGTSEILGADHPYLFNPGDSGQLGLLLETYLNSDQSAKGSSSALLRRIQHFQGMVAQYRALYDRLIKS